MQAVDFLKAGNVASADGLLRSLGIHHRLASTLFSQPDEQLGQALPDHPAAVPQLPVNLADQVCPATV